MTMLTYGVLPSAAEFRKAFEREMEASPRGVYEITLRGSDSRNMEALDPPGWLGNGVYAVDELWGLVKGLVESGSDFALEMASSILYTLGIEWV